MSCLCCCKKQFGKQYNLNFDGTNGKEDIHIDSLQADVNESKRAAPKAKDIKTGEASSGTCENKAEMTYSHDNVAMIGENKGFHGSEEDRIEGDERTGVDSRDNSHKCEKSEDVGTHIIMSGDLSAIASRLEAVANRLENVAAHSSGAGGSVDDVPKFLTAYTDLINKPMQKFVDLSKCIGTHVAQQAHEVEEAFKAQHAFLGQVARCKMPDQALLQKLLKPTSDRVQTITEMKEKNRASPLFIHLSVISESVGVFGWVSGMAKPHNHVKEMADAGCFYGNKVLMEYKTKDTKHVDWVNAWMKLLGQLQEYVREYHSSGLVWNSKGQVASVAGMSGSTAKKATSAGPSGPPPPPVLPTVGGSAPADSSGDKGAMFAQINTGTDVAKGLRKVTNDMKTHKNPALRQTGVVTAIAPAKPAPSSKPEKKDLIKSPKMELDGKKWLVEYQVGNDSMEITESNMRQTVYMYKCSDSMLRISGKINSVIMDSCKRTSVILDDLVSGLEFVNSQSVKCQIMGKVPTISIDKTDGCMVYLSNVSLNVEIVTAKSSEMNIRVPKGDEFTEQALPEQFKSSWNGTEFVTSATDINK